jgi:hypothetical protein
MGETDDSDAAMLYDERGSSPSGRRAAAADR